MLSLTLKAPSSYFYLRRRDPFVARAVQLAQSSSLAESEEVLAQFLNHIKQQIHAEVLATLGESAARLSSTMVTSYTQDISDAGPKSSFLTSTNDGQMTVGCGRKRKRKRVAENASRQALPNKRRARAKVSASRPKPTAPLATRLVKAPRAVDITAEFEGGLCNSATSASDTAPYSRASPEGISERSSIL